MLWFNCSAVQNLLLIVLVFCLIYRGQSIHPSIHPLKFGSGYWTQNLLGVWQQCLSTPESVTETKRVLNMMVKPDIRTCCTWTLLHAPRTQSFYEKYHFWQNISCINIHTHTPTGHTKNITCRWVQRQNTLYQNIKSGLSFPFFSVLITSLPFQSIACKVIVWLTFSLHPSSNQLPSTLLLSLPPLSASTSLSLSHARTFPPGD